MTRQGQMVRQIAEHNHYVQGVAWDPLNEYVATQSSDRSVHIYNLRTKDGEFTLRQHNKVTKMDLPGRRVSASSPAPPDSISRHAGASDGTPMAPASPAPSASIPGTPTSLALPMNPPAISHSRRSSFGSSPSMRRSASPAPSMPLPAVRPMENSPNPFTTLGFKNSNIYANETYTSFFRRLAFAPDGSLLFTPAGQYKTSHPVSEGQKSTEDVINTVYIYTRAGLNKPPIAHLPGHKKPSIAVKCSPVFFTHRTTQKKTVQITLDTSSGEDAIPALPDPMVSTSTRSSSSMDPPPASMERPPSSVTMRSPKETARPTSSPRDPEMVTPETAAPSPAFTLPYRIIYAVATQDSVLVYDTQQQTPLCVVSNLHFATFTDLTWYVIQGRRPNLDVWLTVLRASDGLTLIMSSSDGFCSNLAFAPGELGERYTGPVPTAHHPHPAPLSIAAANSAQPSPIPTPTGSTAPSIPKLPGPGSNSFASPTPNIPASSPTKSRSNSVSSVTTQASHAPPTQVVPANSPTPTMGTVPGVTAGNSAPGSLPLSTPPMTPMSTASASSSMNGGLLGKRDVGFVSESEQEDKQAKRRRIAPTPVVPGEQ